MNTIIEKIRAEVERLKNDRAFFDDNQQLAYWEGLNKVSEKLSDLEKECEKPINAWSNTPIKAKVKETGKYIMGFTDGKGHLHIPVDHNSFLQYNIDELEFDTLQEPTTAEGLEEEIDVYTEKNFDYNSEWDTLNPKTGGYFGPIEFKQIARHFAQWGAVHRGSSEIPKDLEEAAGEYEKEHTYQRYDGGGLTPEYNATLAESFIAGTQWQRENWQNRFNAIEEAVRERPVHENIKDELKDFVLNSPEYALNDDRLLAIAEHFVEWQKEQTMKQMMKEAVEGIYDPYPPTAIFLESDIPEAKHGQKVKLIIVKED